MEEAQKGHFTDNPEYKGSGCLCPGDQLTDVGNQPNITDADSTEQFRTQSIPHYPGNPCAKGHSY